MIRGAATRVLLAGSIACTSCVLLAACETAPGGLERITVGDPPWFEDHLQPYLEARCASLDCHGAPGRPLRMYSVLGLRREPGLRRWPVTQAREPEQLTAQELEDNRLALAAIAAGEPDPRRHVALRKPLALAAGGIAHEGGVHWADTAAPGYICLRGYLVRDVEQDVDSACARALEDFSR